MQKKVYYMIGRLGDSHGSTNDEEFAVRFLQHKLGRSVQVLEGELKELKLTGKQLKVAVVRVIPEAEMPPVVLRLLPLESLPVIVLVLVFVTA